jgi:hypothetical protein
MFEKLSDHLYCFRDLCNVYVVTDGPRAILIDFGPGNVLADLCPRRRLGDRWRAMAA